MPIVFIFFEGSANTKKDLYRCKQYLVDVDAFRFEYDFQNSYQIDLSEFNIKKGRFRLKEQDTDQDGYIYLM